MNLTRILATFVMLLAFSPAFSQQTSAVAEGENAEPVAKNLTEVQKHIHYPEKARKNCIQGSVVVKVLVDETGNPVKFEFLQSPHELLTDAVEPLLPELRFTPGRLQGKPIRTWVTIPFQFKLPPADCK